MNFRYLTKNSSETAQLGRKLAKKFLKSPLRKKTVVITLAGELGSGKTAFLQGFAAGLGIREKILSPTFVIFRKFDIQNRTFKSFYHFDCYRIQNPKEILALGFRKIVSEPKSIVVVEWPGKIKRFLPQDFLEIKFSFVDKDKNKRKIVFLWRKNV